MPKDTEQDILALKEWISKDPNLPGDLDDLLPAFLHSCYYSVEKTEKCIEKFCYSRANMSEVFNSRDPMTSTMQNMFENTVITSNTFEDNVYILYKYDDPTLETFRFYDLLKSLSIQSDIWVKSASTSTLPEGHYIILDMTYFSLKMLPRINIMYFRDFIMFLLEGMPVRVKKIIGINAPSFYNKLFAFVKPALPSYIHKSIHFYTDVEGIYDIIDKKFLPKEYGGEAQSMYEQNQEWRKKIEQDRDFFANDDSWRAKVKKKSKNKDSVMNESFKTLSID